MNHYAEAEGDIHMPIITRKREMMTPTERLAALYAEYDGLLTALEAVQQALQSYRRYHICVRRKLCKERYALRDALADVHEELADYDFVAMRCAIVREHI